MSTTLAEPRAADRSASTAVAPLLAQLAAADRVLQGGKGASLVLRTWPWVCGCMLAAMAFDVVLHAGAMTRLAMTLGIGMLVPGVLAAGAWVAWGRRNSPEHVARVLEAREPRLGSKLINILQLRAQCADTAVAPLTRELAAAAVAGYVEELRGARLAPLARTDRVRRDARQLGFGTLGFLAILAAGFPITRAEVPRFLDPFGDHPPYSFTQLAIVIPGDDSAAVVYGQNILISAKASGHRPGEVFLSFFPPDHPEQRATVPMFDKGEHGFTQQIEGLKTNLVIFAHTKNEHAVSRQRRVAVILTPKLERATVTIAPPAYTGLPPDERALQFKTLRALEGSTLRFRLVSNRPLAQGRISIAGESGTVVPVTMQPDGVNAVSGSLPARESARLRFSIVDVDGYSSPETWELALTVTHDLPPEVQITNPNGDTFVAMDFKAEPVIEAADDYGIATLRIHTARNDEFGEPRVISYDKPPLNAREALAFDFQNMDIAAGDRLSIFAEAIDNAPTPHLTRSQTVTLTVITAEEYNDFLREQMDVGDIEAKYSKLLNEFHNLVEAQRKLSAELEAMKEQLAAAQTDAARGALQKKLDELAAQQQRLNQQLAELAKTMETFVRDQPVYDIEAELKETLAAKAQEIRDSVKQNQEAMQQLAQKPQDAKAGESQPSLGPEALEGFKKASDEQAARLGGAEQQAQQQIAQTLADMSLMHEIVKDMNRFKELYEAQEQLAQQARAYDRAAPLSREDQLALKEMAAQEKAIGDELDAVEQKLWDDGLAAEEKFPKAARSAKELARKMGDLRLQSLAGQATGAMLEGEGGKGAALAENLRGEMEKLFSQCNSKGDEMGDELDQYLSLQRSMKPGNNFRQMMQTRKFGGGKPGFGSGKGMGGNDGYAVINGPNANVMGSERPIAETEKPQRGGPGKRNAKADEAGASVEVDKRDVLNGVAPVSRESGAVQGEAGIEQYSEIVDRYFKAITKPEAAKPKKP